MGASDITVWDWDDNPLRRYKTEYQIIAMTLSPDNPMRFMLTEVIRIAKSLCCSFIVPDFRINRWCKNTLSLSSQKFICPAGVKISRFLSKFVKYNVFRHWCGILECGNYNIGQPSQDTLYFNYYAALLITRNKFKQPLSPILFHVYEPNIL